MKLRSKTFFGFWLLMISIVSTSGASADEKGFVMNFNPGSCWGLATTDLQRITALAVAFDFERLDPSQVIEVKIKDYKIWKDMDSKPLGVGCVRNVEEIMNLEIDYTVDTMEGEGRMSLGSPVNKLRCSKRYVVRTYKNYHESTNWIAPRAYWDFCEAETQEEVELGRMCEAKNCYSRDRQPTYPDLRSESCDCKLTIEKLTYDNVQSRYENFFDPGKHEDPPQGMSSYEDFKESPERWLPEAPISSRGSD